MHGQVWDANALQVACSFSFTDNVNALAMSPCATGHCLIATATAGPDIRLCDPNSGSFSHSLSGHGDGVWAVAWSLQNEWELVTGGCDGQVPHTCTANDSACYELFLFHRSIYSMYASFPVRPPESCPASSYSILYRRDACLLNVAG